MTEIERKLMQVRPQLRLVAPLTHAVCLGYTVVNILIGLGMASIYAPTVSVVIVNSVLTYQFWGAVFIALGVTMGYGLYKNDWPLTKLSLLFGLLVKGVWTFALIFRVFEAPSSILITFVWLFFAYIQAVTYIFFIPKGISNGRPTI